MSIECPECGFNIGLNQTPLLREILECDDCGTQLVVTEINPQIRIETSEEIGEDWGE
ncbi:MAG: lysine biosynthesis protein LysW [Candidatus Aenigmarchaeota archaeon]|nr:lysine biosynthesis protein LysW [Candidatus Aenigmarchaeota archaeon]